MQTSSQSVFERQCEFSFEALSGLAGEPAGLCGEPAAPLRVCGEPVGLCGEPAAPLRVCGEPAGLCGEPAAPLRVCGEPAGLLRALSEMRTVATDAAAVTPPD
jgi:hypothetical protein